jgi:hypothetical protein
MNRFASKITTRVDRTLRLARAASHALVDRFHPLLVHVVPMRRCGLSCAYCNEYDAVSKPVSLELLRARLDRIADLGTSAIVLAGGEPLLHPDLDAVVRHGRRRGMLVAVATAGSQLTTERIGELNEAGLDHLQIRIERIEPDPASTLDRLGPMLRRLADRARFTVAVASAVGEGAGRPEDAVVVARSARQLGLLTSLGIVRRGAAPMAPFDADGLRAYDELRRVGRTGPARLAARFQDNLVRGRPNEWSCRAGARYLYVDEHGITHYCAQQRGKPGIPIEDYSRDDIRREYQARKPCAAYCTVASAQQIAIADSWRSPQTSEATIVAWPAPDEPAGA